MNGSAEDYSRSVRQRWPHLFNGTSRPVVALGGQVESGRERAHPTDPERWCRIKRVTRGERMVGRWAALRVRSGLEASDFVGGCVPDWRRQVIVLQLALLILRADGWVCLAQQPAVGAARRVVWRRIEDLHPTVQGRFPDLTPARPGA